MARVASVSEDLAHLALLKNHWDVDLSVAQIFDNPTRYQLGNADDQRLLLQSKSALRLDVGTDSEYSR